MRACVSIERRSELSRLRARAVRRGEEADGETSRPRALSPALADMRSRNYQTNEIAKKKNEQTNAEKGPKRGWGAIDGFHLEALRAKPNDASVM